MERVYTIRTPEMVRFDFRLAGPVSRFLAWAIDIGVLVVALGVFLLVGCIGAAIIGAAARSAVGIGVVIFGFFALYYGYFAYFEWRWSGRTFGKRSMGLRVLQADGMRIQPFQALSRNLVRVLDSMAPLYLLGGLTVLGTRRLQRLGDLVAGTIVVREERDTAAPRAAALKDDLQNRLLLDTDLLRRMARRLTKDEREVLVDAARRADEIDLEVRGPLMERLARHFAERLEVERDPHVSDERLVQSLARALLAHERDGAAGGT